MFFLKGGVFLKLKKLHSLRYAFLFGGKKKKSKTCENTRDDQMMSPFLLMSVNHARRFNMCRTTN